jgi:hypothetical protein
MESIGTFEKIIGPTGFFTGLMECFIQSPQIFPLDLTYPLRQFFPDASGKSFHGCFLLPIVMT